MLHLPCRILSTGSALFLISLASEALLPHSSPKRIDRGTDQPSDCLDIAMGIPHLLSWHTEDPAQPGGQKGTADTPPAVSAGCWMGCCSRRMLCCLGACAGASPTRASCCWTAPWSTRRGRTRPTSSSARRRTGAPLKPQPLHSHQATKTPSYRGMSCWGPTS